MEDNNIVIENLIYEIRGKYVMLDSDLARLYGVETKYLNRQVKRNIERFPSDYMFQLTKDEIDYSRCQNVTLNTSGNNRGHNIKYLPYVFTEKGIYMLGNILNSNEAINMSLYIINKFIEMKQFFKGNDVLKIDNLEKITIVSSNIDNTLKDKYQSQYSNITFINNTSFHDRFMIIDKKKLYTCGSSFKDMGKKCTYIGEINNKDYMKELLSVINV